MSKQRADSYLGWARDFLMARRVIEPLLWLAASLGVLWALSAWDVGLANEPDRPPGYREQAEYIGLQAAGLAVLLLLSSTLALIGLRRGRRDGWGVLAGVALIASGLGFTRVDDIEAELQAGYAIVPIIAGLALVVLVWVGWPETAESYVAPEKAGWVGAGICAFLCLLAVTMLADVNGWGWIGVHEENQPAWDYGTAYVLLAAGFLAAATHALRRRWVAVGGAVVLGIAGCVTMYALAVAAA